MTLEELLVTHNARVSMVNKWLVFDGRWVVYYHPYHAKKCKTLYSGDSLSEAIRTLISEE